MSHISNISDLGPGSWSRDGLGGHYYKLLDGTPCAWIEGLTCGVWDPNGSGGPRDPDVTWRSAVATNRYLQGACILVLQSLGVIEIDSGSLQSLVKAASDDSIRQFNDSLPKALPIRLLQA